VKGVRGAWLLFGVAGAAVLTACGVPPSDVIEAGGPASGIVSPAPAPTSTPATVSLFFLHDGRLKPYPRRAGDSAIGAVVRLLFEGPTGSEAATATTRLPRLKEPPRVTVVDDGSLSVRLPDGTPSQSRPAVLQLTCTVSYAARPSPAAASSPTPGTGDDRTAEYATAGKLHVSTGDWAMTRSVHACPVTARPRK
jgi:hypothetical protein